MWPVRAGGWKTLSTHTILGPPQPARYADLQTNTARPRGPARSLFAAFDRLDEYFATKRRQSLGRRRWLLSWTPTDDGRWLARLSAPGVARTIERAADTRNAAIGRAVGAMNRLLKFRERIAACKAADKPGPLTR